MQKFKLSGDITDTIDDMVTNLLKTKEAFKKDVLRQANNPRYRINPATETLEFEIVVNIRKIRK